MARQYMFRMNNSTGLMEKREVVRLTKARVVFYHPVIPRRECQEQVVAEAHSWHVDKKSALEFLVTLREEQLKEAVELTEKLRGELGKYRKEYRSKYGTG